MFVLKNEVRDAGPGDQDAGALDQPLRQDRPSEQQYLLVELHFATKWGDCLQFYQLKHNDDDLRWSLGVHGK